MPTFLAMHVEKVEVVFKSIHHLGTADGSCQVCGGYRNIPLHPHCVLSVRNSAHRWLSMFMWSSFFLFFWLLEPVHSVQTNMSPCFRFLLLGRGVVGVGRWEEGGQFLLSFDVVNFLPFWTSQPVYFILFILSFICIFIYL